MASESDLRELSSLFERLVRQRETSLFLPLLIGLTAASAAARDNSNLENPDQERQQSATPTERIILINPVTQSMVVIDSGAGNFESLMRDLGAKNRPLPASKASIEALPSAVIGDGDVSGECAICLEDWEIGGVGKEMPCKHKFHGNCIDKWLGMHGSCPVCRYKMPVDEEGSGKKTEEEGGEEEERESRAIWVRFSLSGSGPSGSGRSDGDSNQTSSNDPSGDVSS